MKRGHVGISALLVGAIAFGAFAATGQGAGPGEVKIGHLVPLTGALKDFGGPGQKAFDLGVAQLNAAAKSAGVDLAVTGIPADTATAPQPAQEAATKLVDSDKVSCIAGPWASAEVVAVAQNVTLDAGVPLISPSSTADSVRKVKDNGLVFRVPPADSLQGPLLAAQVRKALGPKAKVNIGAQNDAYGTGLIASFKPAYQKLGGKIGSTVVFNPTATSFASEAGRIAGGKPKGWVIFTFPGTWAKLGPALVRTGTWNPSRTFGTDGMRSKDLPASTGKKATEGIRGTAPTDTGNSLAPAFQQLWDSAGLGKRQTYDSQTFDAAVLCGLAAVRAGSTDPRKIAAQIRAVSAPGGTKYTFQQLPEALKAVAAGQDIDYQGASGPIDLASNGDPGVGKYALWSYRGGKLKDGAKVFTVKK